MQNNASRKGLSITKSVFAAPPGRYYIGADLDQAHLKVIANYWQIPVLIQAFLEGSDPHCSLAYAVFGRKFSEAPGWDAVGGFDLSKKPAKKSPALAMREIIKTFRYAAIYWADPLTIWGVLTSTETGSGELPYISMDPTEVRAFYKIWQTTEPEWLGAWRSMLELYELQGYLQEPVFNRRSGPLSDGKKNEVVNFPILAAESSVMRIAEHRIMDMYPFDFAGPGTGLIHQCHDSVCVELPLPSGVDPLWRPVEGEPLPPEIERERRRVEEAMTIHIPGWDIPFTAEACVGLTMEDV